MRTLFFLLLNWALSLPYAAAQTRAAGPWQVRYRLTREKEATGDDGAWIKHDTAATVRIRRKLELVPWTINPDSITLFINCKNPLLAPTASRSKSATVRFVATGATVQRTQNWLLVVPSAPTVVLWAYRGQQLVFRHEFKAILPPLPTVKCFVGGCMEANDAPPGEQRIRRTITLRALPNKDFAEVMPEDARYRVARFRATLLRQGKAVELGPGQFAEKTVQGPQGDMSDLTSTSQFGDQLQVAILLVQRQNALGIITEAPVTQQFTIGELKCPPEQE